MAILEFTKVQDHLASIMVQDDLATLMMDSKFGNLQWDDPYQTPASLTGWRVVLQGKCISKTWTCKERMWHINQLEILLVSI